MYTLAVVALGVGCLAAISISVACGMSAFQNTGGFSSRTLFASAAAWLFCGLGLAVIGLAVHDRTPPNDVPQMVYVLSALMGAFTVSSIVLFPLMMFDIKREIRSRRRWEREMTRREGQKVASS